MLLKHTIFFAFLFLSGIYLHAQSTNPCATMSTQDEINACAVMQYTQATQTMDSIYQQVLQQSGEAYKNHIRAMHESWENYLGNACNCESFPFKDTPLEPLIRYQCLTRLTNNYIQQLQQLPWEMPEGNP